MKKRLILVIMMICLLLTGCSETIANAQKNEHTGLKIICTLFPEYDWTKEITSGQDVEVTYLLNGGMDLHNYQPSVKDMAEIADCDVLIYVGGESENWVEKALTECHNPERKVIRLMDALGENVKTEEIKEGMQTEKHHGHEEEHEKEHEEEYDEHVWLSLNRAEILCETICDTLCEIQPECAEAYQANLSAYVEKLQELNQNFSSWAEQTLNKIVLFADRFPFRYLTEDYGIEYYAAFAGCSAETEASFSTITFLAEKLDELHLTTVFTMENADTALAETIISSTKEKNQQIAVLNSMQAVTQKQIDAGANYLQIMQENLHTLKESFS